METGQALWARVRGQADAEVLGPAADRVEAGWEEIVQARAQEVFVSVLVAGKRRLIRQVYLVIL